MAFTADVRDIFFQRDVFKFYKNITKSFLGLAKEDGFIGQEPINTNWIKTAYNENIYESIKSERIICLGTVWGTVDKFEEFTDALWEKLNTDWANETKVIDQAVGNVLIHYDKLLNDCIIYSENRDGPVMTIALTNRPFINLDNDNNILNVIGEITAVVHQYDRFDDLTKIAKNKYYDLLKEEEEEEERLKNKNKTHIISIFIAIILILIIIGIFYYYNYKIRNSEITQLAKPEEEEGKFNFLYYIFL